MSTQLAVFFAASNEVNSYLTPVKMDVKNYTHVTGIIPQSSSNAHLSAKLKLITPKFRHTN